MTGFIIRVCGLLWRPEKVGVATFAPGATTVSLFLAAREGLARRLGFNRINYKGNPNDNQ
jgi:hypothetical protein